ncbi:MAG: hypothetical protein ACOZAM_06560 [Pseudomonadota bacterium]
MKKALFVLFLPLCLSVTPAFAAMSQAECEALWKKADVNGDGNVAGAEAKMYTEAMTGANMKTKDTTGEKIEADEFLKACQEGAFDKIKM